jgi:hypothetical protein
MMATRFPFQAVANQPKPSGLSDNLEIRQLSFALGGKCGARSKSTLPSFQPLLLTHVPDESN